VGLRPGISRARAASLALIAALLVAAPLALAEEPTREQYVAKLEPICKRNTNANTRILKGVKRQVRKGKLKPAGKRFIRAANALGRSIRQMAKVPRPAADAPRLKKWFGYLKRERVFLLKIGRALKAGKRGLAQNLAVKLNKNNDQANDTVILFGFKQCRIESSRFL
jgi:hypothetical protein